MIGKLIPWDQMKEKIVEIIIGSILVGLGGFLLKEMYALNADQRATDEKVSGAISRIDRITSVLPDLRVRIAQEETATPLQAAVVVTDPVKTSSGSWVAPVHLIDIAAKQRHTYLVPVSGPDDQTAAFLASGVGLSLENDAVPFVNMKEWSAEAQKPTSVPTWVVATQSLALRHPQFDYAAAFDKAMQNGTKDAVKEKATVPLEGSSWEKLANELTQNAATYRKTTKD